MKNNKSEYDILQEKPKKHYAEVNQVLNHEMKVTYLNGFNQFFIIDKNFKN